MRDAFLVTILGRPARALRLPHLRPDFQAAVGELGRPAPVQFSLALFRLPAFLAVIVPSRPGEVDGPQVAPLRAVSAKQFHSALPCALNRPGRHPRFSATRAVVCGPSSNALALNEMPGYQKRHLPGLDEVPSQDRVVSVVRAYDSDSRNTVTALASEGVDSTTNVAVVEALLTTPYVPPSSCAVMWNAACRARVPSDGRRRARSLTVAGLLRYTVWSKATRGPRRRRRPGSA